MYARKFLKRTNPYGPVPLNWRRVRDSLGSNVADTPTGFSTVHRKVKICLAANRPFRIPLQKIKRTNPYGLVPLNWRRVRDSNPWSGINQTTDFESAPL